MLRITTTRLRPQDKRRQVLTELLTRLEKNDFTIAGNEPSSFDLKSYAFHWLTYSAELRRYVILYQPLQKRRSGVKLVACRLGEVTLFYDDEPFRTDRLVAATFRTPNLAGNGTSSAHSAAYQTSWIVELVGHWVWDHIDRFGPQLKSGRWMVSGNHPRDRAFSKVIPLGTVAGLGLP